MSFFLNIDTATQNATISVSENEKLLGERSAFKQKDHASFLHPAIKELLTQIQIDLRQLNAIAVSAGPGSYTGLRVGMATAKGLCYALKIPLITLSTLEIIALSIINKINEANSLYCAAIDARRSEIFTAIYDHNLREILKPASMIVTSELFNDIENKIYVSGNGAVKTAEMVSKLFLTDLPSTAQAIAELASLKFSEKKFSDVAYAVPLYSKEFYSPFYDTKTINKS